MSPSTTPPVHPPHRTGRTLTRTTFGAITSGRRRPAAATHRYCIPVVREIAARPADHAGDRTW
jgi:hypothetical protein